MKEKYHWKTYELKRLGMNHKTIKAFMRLQRNEIYANKKYEELKLRLAHNMLTLQVRPLQQTYRTK